MYNIELYNSDFEKFLNYQDHRLPLLRIDLRFQSNQKENTYEKVLNIHIATNKYYFIKYI